MRKLLAIAWNDIKIEFSDPATLVFFLLLPILFTVIVGLGLRNMEGGGDPSADSRYPVLVVDEDASRLSAALLSVLEASEVIRPDLRSKAEAEAAFAEEQAPALLIIRPGFQQALLEGQPVELLLRQNPGDNRVMAIEQAVGACTGQLNSAVQAAHASAEQANQARPFASLADRQEYFYTSLDRARELLQNPGARAVTTQSPRATVQIASGFEQASPGQLVTWTLLTLLGASEVFVNERLGGTLRRLLVTPTPKATMLLGKLSGRLSLGLVQMILLIGFGALFLGVNWGRSPWALALVVAAFALAAVALGVLLATFATTRGQASGLTVMFSMLTAALGGAWWPLEVTPQAFQSAVKVLPTTWAMMGFNDVILRGQGVKEVIPEAGILLAFAAVFFAVGLIRLRYE